MKKNLLNSQSVNPAISVIIPMYNAEEYIGECLDSLLAQTFQDFEVIVANDCSTDNSVEIVKGYMPKFGRQLKLTNTKINSGGCAVPRNVGLPLARGEYVYFMDSDDTLTETALEEVYTLAQEYDADVVYCEKYYMSTGTGEEFIKNIHVATHSVQEPPYIDEPTLEPDDLSERVQKILNKRFWATAWLKLVRRDLLNKHKIIFPDVKPSEDDIWTCGLIFFAKNFLRVPNMIYVRRMRSDSIMSAVKSPKQAVSFWLNPILLGLKDLNKLTEQVEFLQENPQQCLSIFERIFQGKLWLSLRDGVQLTSFEVYETIKNDFSKNFGEYGVLISFLVMQIFNQNRALKNTQLNLNRAKDAAKEVEKIIAEKDAEIKRLKDAMSCIFEFQSLTPAISVIIPMYNAEKYIGELLDSLLIQTFQNFEVIIVDDCSTDNSVKVVENYMSKFVKDRFIIQKLEKNSGTGGGIPRNIGLKFARGEYVYFADADDYLLNSALETFHTAANKFKADVVYASSYHILHGQNQSKILTDGLGRELIKKNLQDKPTLTVDDPDKNLRLLLFEKGLTNPWVHFSRRDFLIKNQILFPETANGTDYIWVIQVYCYAKRLLRIPNALYFYRRYHGESISTRKREPREQVYYWVSTFVSWLKAFSDISSKIEILNSNNAYVLGSVKRQFEWCLNRTGEARKELTDQEIYEILQHEFTKVDISSSLTVPFLFSFIDSQQRKLNDTSNKSNKFDNYNAARVDIQLNSNESECDLRILRVSDEKVNVNKPNWLQKSCVGYIITSYVEEFELVTKSTAEGKIRIILRGLDVRSPEDSSKRIPYWIDYTKLMINDKIILNNLTPTWHDKPFLYNLAVKAGEEVKIKVWWQPHKNNTLEPKTLEQKILTPAQEKIAPKLLTPSQKFETARIDVRLILTAGDFQIFSVSDKNASVTKPRGLQDNGIGYMLTSSAGKLSFIVKGTADGQLVLKLRGLDIRTPENKSKRIPRWISYTKLLVNEDIIFNQITSVWHDEPSIHKIDLKADEEIKIQVEWLPLKNDN